MPKADAVFEGGGMKGIGLLGAVCCMEQKGYTWERLAGTSVGAIMASLLAVGYTCEEIKQIMYNMNYKDFIDKNIIQAIPLLGKPLGFFMYKGILLGNKIEDYLDELLKAKKKTKFKDISTNGISRLKIIASDITQQDILVLPDDIKNYGIDPMDFEIAKAIRMSISIPYVFTPVELNYNDKTHFIVDGGILSNFPIWIFDVKGIPRWPTLGFKLNNNEESKTSLGKKDIISYTFDLVDAILNSNELKYLESKDFVRTISIPTIGIKTMDFDISKEKKDMLFNSGYKAAEEFLKNWSFQMYIRRYRV